MKYGERRVLVGEDIVGILTLPINNLRSPAVLFLHGFASHKDEVGNMFARLADALATKEIGSLRIDFRGWGESGGAMEDTTISRQLADAQIASQYLTSLEGVDPTRVGILGFSLGAAIALLTVAQYPERFKSMTLWAPARQLREEFLRSLGKDNFVYAKRHGQVTINLGWRTVTLKRAFFDSLEAFHPQQAIDQFQGALLAVAGSLDPAAKNAKKYVEAAPTAQKRLVIIDGANHTFNVLSEDQSLATKVIEETSSWISRTLA